MEVLMEMLLDVIIKPGFHLNEFSRFDRIDRFGACAVSKNVDSPSTAIDRFDRRRSSNELNFSIDR